MEDKNLIDLDVHSSIIFTKDTLVLFQEHYNELLHYHETIQIIIGYENPFEIRFNNGEWEEHQGVIIAEDQSFEIETGEGIDAILFVIPDTSKAQKIKSTVLKDSSIYAFDPMFFNVALEELQKFNSGKTNGINETIEELINQITIDFSENEPIGEKVQTAIDFIENNMSHTITKEIIADESFSTPGHLNFLFRQQTGVSMIRFVEWTSMACVIINAANGMRLKDAVLGAGYMSFSDFSHSFTKMFGITPRQLLTDEIYTKAVTKFSDSYI
jgi:AraC-like DNA-binding protein